ncbi:glycosyltransferase [Phenylobacterium kunshanense]|uniref:Glycosyl transferase family 1 domain-containing protein n=1 Tax=Phenylobacterium kunshanense TaxID=1445034 RepID=A0A328BFQ5_9CAUL|nr:glycosyltransferase [Phenylobacterium kunshanense]RAK66292.1 hypothetical protein DJ019_08540 [Phenylobacterium kunshanense]
MHLDHQTPEIEQALARARTPEQLEEALLQISRMVPSLMAPEVRGHRLFCSGLDKAVSELPRRLGLHETPLTKGQDNVVILATQLFATGGHSKVATDITQILGAEKVTIICTDIYRKMRYKFLINHINPTAYPLKRRADVILSAPTLVEKVVELYCILSAIRPSRIFLMNNHMDAVAVAGAWPFRNVVDYVHHANFMPAIGSSLKFSAHADLTYPCHLACRDAGLDPVYAAMMANAESVAPAAIAAADKTRLRIATCGSQHKYRHPARHRWADFVVAALSAADAEIVHIGAYDDDFAAEMVEALTAAGLNPDRYRFVGRCDNLMVELARQQADIYLASYPEGGGRAAVEAVAAGLPLIIPEETGHGPLMADHWPLPQAQAVTTPEELAAAIRDRDRLIAAAKDPANIARVRDLMGRFTSYVSGVPIPAVDPDVRFAEFGA